MADFRDGTDTLGVVIKKFMTTRDAHWAPVEAPRNDTLPQTPEKTRAANKGKGNAQARASTQQQETKLSLMNGERLCPAFQKGTCRTQGGGCAAGLHKCAVVTSEKGRVCGSSDHGACDHAKKVGGKDRN